MGRPPQAVVFLVYILMAVSALVLYRRLARAFASRAKTDEEMADSDVVSKRKGPMVGSSKK